MSAQADEPVIQQDLCVNKTGIRLKKNTIWSFFAVLFFKITLDISYFLIISQVWRYEKFDLQFNGVKFAESYFLLIIIFIFLPKSTKKLSNILVWLLILISYVPMLTYYALNDESRIYMYSVTFFWIAVLLLLHAPDLKIKPLKQSAPIRNAIFICLNIIGLIIIYINLGFSFNLDLRRVYLIRSEYINLEIPLAGYMFNWIARIVNPIFFAIFVSRKNWYAVICIILIQLLVFSFTGFKTYLFALPFVLVLIWIVQRSNPIVYLASGLACVVLLGMVSYWIIDDKWISALFTNRTLLVPAQLSFMYYDFFSQNQPVFLSHSIFRYFIVYPYHLDPPNLIAEVYFNSPQTSANNGVVADAYMNFGFIGLALWAGLLAIIMKLVDACSKGVDQRISVAAIAMPALGLTNTGLLTNFLTVGLLLALILLYLLPRKKDDAPCPQKCAS